MIYLSVEKLSKQFPEHQLFADITFGISKGDKVALIADNGSGKSTLIRILAGKEVQDEGTIFIRDEIRVGFLDQEPDYDHSLTIEALIKAEHQEVQQVIRDYYAVLEQQGQHQDSETNDRFESLSHRMDLLNAWDYDRDLKAYLTRFRIDDLKQKVGTMSGGQRKRLALAITLANHPDLLILDEPTNHLDIDMIEWLEEHLAQSSMTLLMVTHDRYFLDTVCNQILELHQGKLYRHQGKYAYFLEKRAEREAVFDREIEKANSLLKVELEWMRRQPQARTTKAKSRIDAYYDLESKANSRRPGQDLILDVKMSRIGGKILELKKVRKAYGDLTILNDFTYTFKKGDRVGIVGPNGVGKSTLLNMFTGKEQPDSGKVNRGDTIIFGYYSQEGLLPDEHMRIIDVMKEIADVIELSDGRKVSASQFLEYFMFPPSVQYKPVEKLSGGEKRRLYLLTVLIRNPNFLILDEPTNDLDLLTLNKLEAFLHGFPGCLVLVSHDRYFMDKLVDHLFIFTGDGQIKDYNGTYSEYRLSRKPQIISGNGGDTTSKTKSVVPKATDDQTRPSKKEKNEFRKLEREIDAMEQEKQALEQRLAVGESSLSVIQEISEKIGILVREIEQKTERWMELADKF